MAQLKAFRDVQDRCATSFQVRMEERGVEWTRRPTSFERKTRVEMIRPAPKVRLKSSDVADM